MSLTALSPLDGRYYEDTKPLRAYFSEYALMRYRVYIEIEYLIALGKELGVKECKELSSEEQTQLKSIYKNFSINDAQDIKQIEEKTKHDVKAIEYFLQEKLQEHKLSSYIPFLHFALTSEDINNLAYSLMWQHAIQKVYSKELENVYLKLQTLSQQYVDLPMLSMTHGQPATPTTMGKELNVFAVRLQRQIQQLKNHRLQGKLNGATGTFAAHTIAYPDINWFNFSKKFISSLGLEPLVVTTQVNPYDSLAESYQTISRINTILLDLSRDMWLYISRSVFKQKINEEEVGSSTMPHKVNPIYFENAEGNVGISNALFNHLIQSLPVSRMQRDLSNSTLIRNQGISLAHSLIAIKNSIKGLERAEPDEINLKKELDEHWEVLAEAVQTVLRKYGKKDAYDILKKLTQGIQLNKNNYYTLIDKLEIPLEEKEKLKNLTPHTYIGLSEKLIS